MSRATLRNALAELEDRGLVTRHQGRGTFVARPRVQQDPARFFSLGEALRARGEALVSTVLDVGIVAARGALAEELGLAPGTALVRLRRLRSVGGQPLTLEDTHLPAALFPGLETRDFTTRSLYDVLAEDYRCVVVSAVETLEPVVVTRSQALLLRVARGAPALLVRRVTTDRDGRTVEHAEALLRGDRARLLLRRQVPGLATGVEAVRAPVVAALAGAR